MVADKLDKSVRFPQPDPHTEIDSLSSTNDDASSIISTLSDVPSDIIIKSRIKYGSVLSACKGIWLDYSKNSNIHGVKYMFEIHSSIYEKLFWISVWLVSLYFAISLIVATFLKWQDTPVILGFDETLIPVHRIPFPTVTICPEIKTDQNTFNFGNVSKLIENVGLGNLTEDELSYFAATLQLCDLEVVEKFASLIPKDIISNIPQTLVDLSISKNETGPFCMWNGRFYFCDKILNFVATDDGICYQFNGMETKDIYRDPEFVSHIDDQIVDYNNYFDVELPRLDNVTGNWSLDDGYVGQSYNSYPQRTIFSSARNGFFAFLQGFGHNFDYTCRKFKTQGYKVFLNSPESVPSTSSNYILVPHGFEVMVSVLPHYIMSDDNLHDFIPAKRQCYFNDERHLHFFQFYSQSNCQTECLANYTIKICKCAKFWMPKPVDVPICGVADIDCYTAAELELNLMIQNQTVQKGLHPETEIQCDCMPACTSLDYNFEISRAVFDFPKTLQAFREVYEHTDATGSRLSVYFKEHQFTAIRRTVLFSVTSLIANCGGIFGLFMGISSLSLIELIYFFSVRLPAIMRKRYQIRKKFQKLEAQHQE